MERGSDHQTGGQRSRGGKGQTDFEATGQERTGRLVQATFRTGRDSLFLLLL